MMKNKYVKICKNPNCKRPFQTMYWKQAYCEDCKNKIYNYKHPAQKTKLICLWCHEEFLTCFTFNAKYCSQEHGEFFRKIQQRIYKLGFDQNRELQEFAKLKQEGQFYKLPEVKP